MTHIINLFTKIINYVNKNFFTPAMYTIDSVPAILTGNSIKKKFFRSKIKFHSLHIWKYAKVATKCFGPQIDPKYPVAIAGDFLEGPNVEAAFISGNKAANLIFDRLK